MLNIAPLRARSEFLRLKKAKAVRAPLFILQAAPAPIVHNDVRVGFIITKKIGNAVVRNRIRRRLKAALQTHANSDKHYFNTGWDYVLIPRLEVISAPFEALEQALVMALKKLEPKHTA